MVNLIQRMLSRPGRRAPIQAALTAPHYIERHIEFDETTDVRIGEVAAQRLSAARGDPLEIGVDAAIADGEDRLERISLLAWAALTGRIAVGPEHQRARLHPITTHMLGLAGVNADAFAALAQLRPSAGFYVDDRNGRTLAKSIDNEHRFGEILHPHVRVRVPASTPRPAMTWWQEQDGTLAIGVPELPSTLVAHLPGRPLSDLMDIPTLNLGRILIERTADAVAGDDAPMTILRMREPDADGRP